MSLELLKLRWQIATGATLEAWGNVTRNCYSQLAGRQQRLDGEMQYSLSVSRRQMQLRRKRATALLAPRG